MAHKQLGSRDYKKKLPTYKIGHCVCSKCATLNEIFWTREEILTNVKIICDRSFTSPEQIFPELSTIRSNETLDKEAVMPYNVINVNNLTIIR